MLEKPNVFIIESLGFGDEKAGRYEGRILSQVLKLSGSKVRYFYIRTEQELEEVLDQFKDSQYRYLHFSCHGSSNGIALTLGHLSFKQLGKLLAPCVDYRRVFFSSCQVATTQLAAALMKGTKCYSVIGPSIDISFDRAAIFWASFYHLMLRDEANSMKKSKLKQITSSLQHLFGLHMRYFTRSSKKTNEIEEVDLEKIVPQPA